MIKLIPQKLTQQAFSPFGKVIELNSGDSFFINEGSTKRHHALAEIDVNDQNGQAIISIFEATSRDLPITIKMMEKHPLGSQAFLPAEPHEWLIVVATGDEPRPENCTVFLASANQGVQYGKNIWHYPLLPLVDKQNFWVIDRTGQGNNLVEFFFKDHFARIQL